MFNMNVRINAPHPEARVLAAIEFAQYVLDNQVLKDSNYFIPMDTQALERSGIMFSQLGDGVVRWQTPYARKVYYDTNINFSVDKNPRARALWFEAAKSQFGNSWVTLAKNAVKSQLPSS